MTFVSSLSTLSSLAALLPFVRDAVATPAGAGLLQGVAPGAGAPLFQPHFWGIFFEFNPPFFVPFQC